jgi:intein/homing endonuclease
MSRLTIYDRLKPEIKEALHSSENDKYKASIDNIVEALSSTTFYSDLKISDVSSLYTFSNLELIKVSAWDFKYGDNILISKDYE